MARRAKKAATAALLALLAISARGMATETLVAVQSDKGLCCLWMESLMGVGGHIIPPPEWARAVISETKKRGGLYVADEVQVGMGRVGMPHWWGFETFVDDTTFPDIVAIGKPLGNGHPIAAVVTTD
eukprot:gene15678-4720_t